MCTCMSTYKIRHTYVCTSTVDVYMYVHIQLSPRFVCGNIHRRCVVTYIYTSYCNILQHTATYCNALQRTATRCNTLQHTYSMCGDIHIHFNIHATDGDVYMYICTYIYSHIYIHIYIYFFIYVYIYIQNCIFSFIFMYIYISMYVFLYKCI